MGQFVPLRVPLFAFAPLQEAELAPLHCGVLMSLVGVPHHLCTAKTISALLCFPVSAVLMWKLQGDSDWEGGLEL